MVETMSKTSILTLRLPPNVRRGVERLASQLGYKPAQLGARLIEEGLRRRYFPNIELRDTAAGRVAYIKGTRLAVYWIVQRVREGMAPEKVSADFDLSAALVNAALAYAEAFRQEIDLDLEEAEANGRWLESEETAWRTSRPSAHEERRSKERK